MDYATEGIKKNALATIAMVVDNEFYGDARVKNEAKILISKGLNVKVLCFSFGKAPRHEMVDGVEVYRIGINKKLKDILFGISNLIPIYHYFWQFTIIRFIKAHNISAVHTHDLYMARSAGKASRRLNIPLIIDLHENYPEAIMNYKWANSYPKKLLARPNHWKILEPKFLAYASKIVTTTKVFAQILSEKHKISFDKFIVYPNVPDLNEMENYPIVRNVVPNDDRFYIFYFGGISERRGIYTCIDAIKILNKKYSNIYLLLIGPVDKAEEEAFNAQISDPEVESKIIYKQWIDISEFPSYVTASNVCISPILKSEQHETTIANKIFQYMTFSKPLIVSNCKPQIEVIEEANCGLVFESDNAHDLAQKIEQLYNNRDLCSKLGENGKRMVINKYNTTYFGKRLVDNYRSLLNK